MNSSQSRCARNNLFGLGSRAGINYTEGGGRNHRFEEKARIEVITGELSGRGENSLPTSWTITSLRHTAGDTDVLSFLPTGEKCCNSEEPTVERFLGGCWMVSPPWECSKAT